MLPRKAKTMSLLPAHVPYYAEDKLVWYGPLALCPSCPRFVLFVHSVCVSYTIYIQPTGRALLNQTLSKFHFPFTKKSQSWKERKGQMPVFCQLWLSLVAIKTISLSLFLFFPTFSLYANVIFPSLQFLYYSLSVVIPTTRWPQGVVIVKRRIGGIIGGNPSVTHRNG